MRVSDLRAMTDEELDDALANPARLKLAKREIARILTVRNERAAGVETT